MGLKSRGLFKSTVGRCYSPVSCPHCSHSHCAKSGYTCRLWSTALQLALGRAFCIQRVKQRMDAEPLGCFWSFWSPIFASTELCLYCSTEALRDQSKCSFEHQWQRWGLCYSGSLWTWNGAWSRRRKARRKPSRKQQYHIGEEVHTHESLKNLGALADHNSTRPLGFVLLF